jgi:glycosyltransferase involved in cell wall biosynthesis
MTSEGEAPGAALAAGVTVVIPAYNYARFLPHAIDSALRQTHRPLEILVVDDGSTDHTRAVVAAYGERVRYLYQPNAGLSAARNTGIQNASHPFIALLDADDQWLPERVRSGMAAFGRLAEDFGVVACRSHRMDAEGRTLPVNPGLLELSGEVTAADILLATRFSPSAAIIRREVFEDCGGFDATLRSSEDRDLWIRAGRRWRLWLQPERLALIRKHGANMSSHADRMKFNMGRVIKKSWRGRAQPRHRLDYWLQVEAICHYQTALIYHGLGRRRPALRDILLSVCAWPLPIASRKIASTASWVRLRTLWHVCFDPPSPAASQRAQA